MFCQRKIRMMKSEEHIDKADKINCCRRVIVKSFTSQVIYHFKVSLTQKDRPFTNRVC